MMYWIYIFGSVPHTAPGPTEMDRSIHSKKFYGPSRRSVVLESRNHFGRSVPRDLRYSTDRTGPVKPCFRLVTQFGLPCLRNRNLLTISFLTFLEDGRPKNCDVSARSVLYRNFPCKWAHEAGSTIYRNSMALF
jgi:hypothetical protein